MLSLDPVAINSERFVLRCPAVGLLPISLVVSVLSTVLMARAEPPPPNAALPLLTKARHEILTTAAWKALAKHDYNTATIRADDCLDDFLPLALRMQKKLEADKVKIAVGNVTEAEKKRIFANGVLNDVAACLYIKGFSSERLERLEDAESTYLQAARCTYARVWDETQELFWSVAEVCEVRARALRLPPQEREAHLAELDRPTHERETGKAWDAFNARDYKTAEAHADKCIKQFFHQAQKMQRKLSRTTEPIPVGAVTEAQKKKIFSNGVLNDVATCLFIKGRCAERLRQIPQAKEAYSAATKLTHARCWDPQGWFWSVSEAAVDRLEFLQ